MQPEPDSPEHHRQRSEFIRKLVQRRIEQRPINHRYIQSMPSTIVQYWHDLRDLPEDVKLCVASWARWKKSGFTHQLFDESNAEAFIRRTLGERHQRAFKHCYHPAMQADYFRLCYVLVEGGCYVDADDVCVGTHIGHLFEDGRLRVQPLCYDISSGAMVAPSQFLEQDAYDSDWIFYFNNNPLMAGKGHPIVESSLEQATKLLETACADALPDIQTTTGPGNLSKSIFNSARGSQGDESELLVLRDWDSVAISKWPLSYRADARNWRLSNRTKFCPSGT